VFWHPQWLLMIVPFFALTYLYIKDAWKLYLIDLAGMLAFIYITVNQWENNVDVAMLGHGMLRSLFTYIPLSTSQLFVPQFTYIFMGIFFVYLFSPLLIQVFQGANPLKQETLDNARTSSNYLRARFYLGLSIFMIPALFCAFAPKDIARRLDPTAYTIPGLAIQPADVQVGDINRNVAIRQSFIADYDRLFSVNVQLSTFDRVNQCQVMLTLFDESNTPLAQRELDCQLIVDNAYYTFDFHPIAGSAGQTYFIDITSNGTGRNSITAWKSSQDLYPAGKLYRNGREETGDLSIALFYEQ
jgi:hypothetical protein